jgi:ribosomal protein S5
MESSQSFAVLPIAPSTYSAVKACEADPQRRPARAQRDAQLRQDVERVWRVHRRLYGARRLAWHATKVVGNRGGN